MQPKGNVICNIQIQKLVIRASAQIHGNICAQSVDFHKGTNLIELIYIENGDNVAVYDEAMLEILG